MQRKILLIFGPRALYELFLYQKTFSVRYEEKEVGFLEILAEKPALLLLDEPSEALLQKVKQSNISYFVLYSHGEESSAEKEYAIEKPLQAHKLQKKILSFFEKERYRLELSDGIVLDLQQRQIICDISQKNVVNLTEKEVALINYLYHAPYNSVERSELLHHIWGYSKDVSTHTLETHWYRLRQKLQGIMELTVTPGGQYCLGEKELAED